MIFLKKISDLRYPGIKRGNSTLKSKYIDAAEAYLGRWQTSNKYESLHQI